VPQKGKKMQNEAGGAAEAKSKVQVEVMIKSCTNTAT
jgi:hypothetical protein